MKLLILDDWEDIIIIDMYIALFSEITQSAVKRVFSLSGIAHKV